MNEYFMLGGRKFVLQTEQYWQILPSPNPRWASSPDNPDGLPSAPDIVVLSEDAPRVILTKEWQEFLIALNPNMPRNNVAGLLGSNKAFTNKTGFPTALDPTPRKNYITNENLNAAELPRFDKDRTCAYACHKGVVAGNQLVLETLDGSKPPPSIEAINPITAPHLFFHATVVGFKNGVEYRSPFPNGAPAWGYAKNYVSMPLVAAHEIRIPLSMVRQVNGYQLPYTQ